jgi:hypothetical protein
MIGTQPLAGRLCTTGATFKAVNFEREEKHE